MTSFLPDDTGWDLANAINNAEAVGLAGCPVDGTDRLGEPLRRDHMALFVTRWFDVVVEEGLAEVPDG